jgi:LysM repeat protein
MSNKDNAQNVISAYRKRQQLGPFLIGGLAVVLVIVGIVVLIVWLTGPNRPVSMRPPTETPTSTETTAPTSTVTKAPTATLTNTPTITVTASPTLTPTVAGPFEYVVQSGDNCTSIAAKFKVDVMVLIALNNLDGKCIINVADKIMIPAAGQTLPSATPIPTGLAPGTKISITVNSGDTLGGLAFKYNSTVAAIKTLNNLTSDTINAGDILQIPVNIVTPVPTRGPTKTPNLVNVTITATQATTATSAATATPAATATK